MLTITKKHKLVTLTPKASSRLKSLLQEEGKADLGLRIYVEGGGCHGFQYGMHFDEKPGEGDEVVEVDGVKVFIDPASIKYLQGSIVDYVDSMIGGGFSVQNPNALSSCGCGHSFRVTDAQSTDEAAGDVSVASSGSCH